MSRLTLLVLAMPLVVGCQMVAGIEDRRLVDCVPGATRCATEGRQTCDDAGAWVDEPCPADRGICTPEGACVACEQSDGTVIDPTAAGDCKVVVCRGGLLVEEPSVTDLPSDTGGDCLRPTCDGMSPTVVADDADHVDDGDACTFDRCVGGSLLVDPAVAPEAPCELAKGTSGSFTCARRGDRRVVCWGANDLGQLGLGNDDPFAHPDPEVVPGLPPVRRLAVGLDHACALLEEDGAIRCWGDNTYGQVNADGPSAPVSVPQQVDLGVQVIDIVADANVTCATLADRTSRCWGRNDSGQLADGTVSTFRAEPMPLEDPNAADGLLHDILQVDFSLYSACALSVQGDVRCWGQKAIVGLNELVEGVAPFPRLVYGSVAQIAAGDAHVCALTTEGQVACWGYANLGQTADPGNAGYTGLPRLAPVTAVTRITTGQWHTCAAVDAGVTCWGDNRNGELGNDGGCTYNGQPGCESAVSPYPVAVAGITGPVEDLAAGWHHSCAMVDGAVRCWGRNLDGQLGDGTTTTSDVPVDVAWPW